MNADAPPRTGCHSLQWSHLSPGAVEACPVSGRASLPQREPHEATVRYHASVSGVHYPKLTLKMGNLPRCIRALHPRHSMGGSVPLGTRSRSLRDFQVRL